MDFQPEGDNGHLKFNLSTGNVSSEHMKSNNAGVMLAQRRN